MTRKRKIYEGKAKILYKGPKPGTLVQFFKDDATAFNAQKHEVIDGKGVLNNRISEHIFENMNKIGLPTHFIKRINMREQLIKEVEIIPVEIIVRNIAAGSIVKRLGLEEGVQLPRSIVEFCYKNDELNDPVVSRGTHNSTRMGNRTRNRRYDGTRTQSQRLPNRTLLWNRNTTRRFQNRMWKTVRK